MPTESDGTNRPNPFGVTDNQASAVKALAEFGTTVVTEIGNLARYMGRVLGTVPEDILGVVIGDPLHFVRTVIAGALDAKVQKIHERRGVKETQGVSPSLGIPLLRAAYDESRPELQDIWAALIAAAMDPERAARVRISFIDTLKRFDPLDALVLKACYERKPKPDEAHPINYLSVTLNVPGDEILISNDNLENRLLAVWGG